MDELVVEEKGVFNIDRAYETEDLEGNQIIIITNDF